MREMQQPLGPYPLERARDSTKLYEAVQIKLGEQRRFVLWWDKAKHGGEARPGRPISQNGEIRLADYGLDDGTVHRWRQRLKDPKKFDQQLEKAHERCVKVCEASQGHASPTRAPTSGENDWYTPAKYVEAAREVMGGLDLDLPQVRRLHGWCFSRC